MKILQYALTPRRNNLPTVKIAPIARGHAGKSACLDNLARALRGTLPGNFRFGSDDPRQLVVDIKKGEATHESLSTTGLAQTMTTSARKLGLQESNASVATVELFDIVGQVLTNTTVDSPAEQQALYEEYIRILTGANVLWAIISPPCEATDHTMERFEVDLEIVRAYLVKALRLHQNPCTVVLAISKIDTLFDSEATVRQKFDRGQLTDLVRPLVDVVSNMPNRVSHSAIFPFSSLGFGKSKPLPANGRAGDPEFETEWILKDGFRAQPFNILPMVVYSTLHGLKQSSVGLKGKRDLAKMCQRLEAAFNSTNPCYQPIL